MLKSGIAGALAGAVAVALLRLLAPEVSIKEFFNLIGLVVLVVGLLAWWMARPRLLGSAMPPPQMAVPEASAPSTLSKVRRLRQKSR